MKNKTNNIVKIAGRVLSLAAAVLPVAGMEGCGRELALLSEQTVMELGAQPDLYAGHYVYLGERDAQKAVVDFSGVNTGAVGVYPASVRYGRQEVSFEVLVQDTTEPKLSVNSHVTATVGVPLYASEVVIDITEASGQAEIFFVQEKDELQKTDRHTTGSDGEAEGEAQKTESQTAGSAGNAEEVTDGMEDEEIPDGESFVSGEVLCTNGAVVYGQIGEYELLVMAADASGNCAVKTVQVTVGEPPVFSGICDRQLTVGDMKYDYLGGVTAVDYRGTDITERVVCDSTEVDVSVEGEYEIRYFVRDDQGFFAEECAMVTVRGKGAGTSGSRTGAGGKQSDTADGKKAADTKRNTVGAGGEDGTGQSIGGTGGTGQGTGGTGGTGSVAGAGQGVGGTGGTGQGTGGTGGTGSVAGAGQNSGGSGTGNADGTGGTGSVAGAGQNSGGSGTGGPTGTGQGGSGTGGTTGTGQAAGEATPGGGQQPDSGNPSVNQPVEGQGTSTLEDLGFEAYIPEAGTGADDGTDLGGTSEWY